MKFLKIGLLCCLFILCSCAVNFNTPPKQENTYNLTTERLLRSEKHAEKIQKFYESGVQGFFTGKASIKIFYKTFKQPTLDSPAIFISSGRTEAALKYKELIFDLYNNGYSVYIHDHRGQGLSGRMTEDSDMGYIDEFQYYIDDMKYFYNTIANNAKHSKKYLVAHSMGGAIGMRYLEQYPLDFNAAAFSSPMLGFVRPTCSAAKFLTGDSPKYALGQGKYQAEDETFKDNKLTGSQVRYHRMNTAFSKKPEARLGGASYQWVYKSCKQFKEINHNIKRIKTPFILFSAENESIVSTNAHEQFIEKAKELGKECKAFLVKNAQHELFIEKDTQRIKTLNEIFKYFKAH